MKQHSFIDSVINSLVLDYGIGKGKYTPYGYVLLVKNEGGDPSSVSFN